MGRRQEEERARKEAEKVQKYTEQGRPEMAEKAQARMDTAQNISQNIVAPIVQNTAKVGGTTFKKVYKVNVLDLKMAVKSCLENDILSNYVDLDVKGIERLANAQKGKLSIEGIQIVEDVQVGMRTK